MRIKLSRSAERDLSALRAYIGVDNQNAADDVSGRLVKAFLLIRAHPEIGRPSPSGKTREWSVPGLPYLIPYKVRPGVLYILRIWHTSQNRPEKW
ncbi:type II toxin-antitoxin system RelE/ParE family toxin [Mesorhizobium sp. ASY16-5R]|uniref:type II toxin-antitoxin system RelE/ParE family toxin n=1 Tax=Mesorhizobium sp. ASY16-5R TaxID=3445772 RepID=UPI003FA070E2